LPRCGRIRRPASGKVAIRRSRLLDVRSITVADLARADADGQAAAVEQLASTDAAGIGWWRSSLTASCGAVKLTLGKRRKGQPPW
jgi:hypothetical protein